METVSEAEVKTGPRFALSCTNDRRHQTRPTAPSSRSTTSRASTPATRSVVRALADASFSIVAGEWVAITGPSGSGKSTLVNLIGCLDRPTAGELKIDNVDVAHDRHRTRPLPRRQDRLHLPAVPPDPVPVGARKRHARPVLPLHDRREPRPAPHSRKWPRVTASIISPVSSPAANNNASASPAPSSTTHRSFWLTSPPATSTPPTRRSSPNSSEPPRQGHTIVMVTHDPEMAAPRPAQNRPKPRQGLLSPRRRAHGHPAPLVFFGVGGRCVFKWGFLRNRAVMDGFSW